ncbi:MAG: hypothetical protein WCY58_01985 [Mariniphaga sp.]|nr:hypothetical protein [Mariniphaga sp.]MDD4425427.1 hypothetical protein [Mariniphaga sp.]
MNLLFTSLLYFGCFVFTIAGAGNPVTKNDREEQKNRYVQGWNILSDDEKLAEMVIEHSRDYSINHLQLSHHLIMDLRHAKNPARAARINRLVNRAHEAGIPKVLIWDHMLYPLDYYPEEFRTGPGNLIDLDNPEFWAWIKNDYREMLRLVPEIDGLILTFIETGARIENQYSRVLKTPQEKLAAMIDTISSLIIDEKGLELYVRTFFYTRQERENMLNCLNLIQNEGLRVMTKEVPHDFFLTHPSASYVGNIKFPVIIEFDAAHEYNGQGIIASIFPDLHLKRWESYKKLPNVIGYVARSLSEGLTDLKEVALEMYRYPFKGPVGQFEWEEDIYRGLAYYNAIQNRQSDGYTPKTFPQFPYKGIPPKEREKIWYEAFKDNER